MKRHLNWFQFMDSFIIQRNCGRQKRPVVNTDKRNILYIYISSYIDSLLIYLWSLSMTEWHLYIYNAVNRDHCRTKKHIFQFAPHRKSKNKPKFLCVSFVRKKIILEVINDHSSFLNYQLKGDHSCRNLNRFLSGSGQAPENQPG